MRVLVTGANGFVGARVCEALVRRGLGVRRAVRASSGGNGDVVGIGDIGPDTDWAASLRDVDVVIHLAGRAHVMREVVPDPLAEFRRVNVGGTAALSRAAHRAGVRRLVFVSSAKVHGDRTTATPFTESDALSPGDAYARSKVEAEQALWSVAAEGDVEIVVIRPPLVYGPRVKGNFLQLLQWTARGWPLPFGHSRNRRSLIGVGNLADFCVHCAEHPRAAGQTFLVADGEDLPMRDLVVRLAAGLGKPSRLWAVPGFCRTALHLIGRRDLAIRLFDSLQIDFSKARRDLGWTPPMTVDDGIGEVTTWYRSVVCGSTGIRQGH